MGVSGIHLLEKKNQQGFTIVELLIVILIIGVLVTLVIVTYNGITTRAENTKTTTAVEAWAKVIYSYGLDNGAYPAYNYPCLGAAYPSNKCANTTDNTVCIGAGATVVNATFNNLVRPYFGSSTPPQPSTQKMNCGGKDFVGSWYGSNGVVATIVVLLKGNVNPCPGISGTIAGGRYQQDDMTLCYKTLPTL